MLFTNKTKCDKDNDRKRCQEKLDCNHKCPRYAGKCAADLFHAICSQICKLQLVAVISNCSLCFNFKLRVIICVYLSRCSDRCDKACPPCTSTCDYTCIYQQKCSNKCGDPCKPLRSRFNLI